MRSATVSRPTPPRRLRRRSADSALRLKPPRRRPRRRQRRHDGCPYCPHQRRLRCCHCRLWAHRSSCSAWWTLPNRRPRAHATRSPGGILRSCRRLLANRSRRRYARFPALSPEHRVSCRSCGDGGELVCRAPVPVRRKHRQRRVRRSPAQPSGLARDSRPRASHQANVHDGKTAASVPYHSLARPLGDPTRRRSHADAEDERSGTARAGVACAHRRGASTPEARLHARAEDALGFFDGHRMLAPGARERFGDDLLPWIK